MKKLAFFIMGMFAVFAICINDSVAIAAPPTEATKKADMAWLIALKTKFAENINVTQLHGKAPRCSFQVKLDKNGYINSVVFAKCSSEEKKQKILMNLAFSNPFPKPPGDKPGSFIMQF